MRLTQTHKFFDSLLLFLLVFSGGGLLFVFNRKICTISLFCIALFVIIFMGKRIKSSVFNSSLFSLIFLFSVIIINYLTSIGNQEVIKYYFHLLNISSCVLISTHFLNNRDKSYFLNRIRFILKVVLFYSIFNFLFYIIVKNSLTQIIYNSDKTMYTFSQIFFYNPEKSSFHLFGIELVRNQGWFWEPGINQIYLNIFLYLEGFVFKKNRWIILLIVLTIFTTYSTTGMIIMLIILFFIFKSSIKRNPILVLLVIGIMIPFYFITKTNIEEKLDTSSFQKRYFDLIQTLSIAKDYPLTGIGLDVDYFSEFRSSYNMDDEFRRSIELSTSFESKTKSTEKGSSNSVTYLMAAMGFPISFFLLYCMFKQTLFTHKKGILMMIILISVFSEPLLLRPFFLIFIISGMIEFFSKFTKLKLK
jgi:hypothetical protein